MDLHAVIEPLAWESDFFNVTSGKIVVDPAAAPLTPAALDAFQVVQAKVAADNPQRADALVALGFRLVDGEIDCSLRVPKRGGLPGEIDCSLRVPKRGGLPGEIDCGLRVSKRGGGGDGVHGRKKQGALGDLTDSVGHGTARLSGGAPHDADPLRIAGQGDTAAVSRLALSAFSLSRFREPWYRDEDRRRFYAVWAQNAILGTFDHVCLVKGRPGAIEGMVTLRRLGVDDARIGLLAVDPAFTRRGIGRILFAGALAWCRPQGISRLHVATQTGNLAALRLYIACGANVDSTAYWFYR